MSRQTPKCLVPPPPEGPLRPVLDVYDLAVRLEMEGVTDAVAEANYGFSSTLAMARWHSTRMERRERRRRKPPTLPSVWQFLHGVAFAIPILICTASALLYRLSLWGGDLSGEVASAVAMGTIGSFVLTGGLVQAAARRTLYQIHMGNWDAARATSFRWSLLGVQILGGSIAAGWLLNQYFGWLTYPVDWVATSFHFALGLLWLACGMLYVLELSWTVGGAVLAGIGAVAFLHKILGLEILNAQIWGILFTASLCFAMALTVFRRKRAGRGTGEFLTARIAHDTAPYFFYGTFYYMFLFTDRFIAWTAQTAAASLPLQFRGDYETALDISMIAFIAQAGWVHMSMLAFYRRLKAAQEKYTVSESGDFNRELRTFYLRRASLFLPAAAAVGVLTYLGAQASGLIAPGQMEKVVGVAVTGYPFLVLGLWNVSLLFALSRPAGAVAGIALGLSANVLAGYLASRIGAYPDAAYGFAAGSVVFAVMTTYFYLRVSRAVDYRHFAAAA